VAAHKLFRKKSSQNLSREKRLFLTEMSLEHPFIGMTVVQLWYILNNYTTAAKFRIRAGTLLYERTNSMRIGSFAKEKILMILASVYSWFDYLCPTGQNSLPNIFCNFLQRCQHEFVLTTAQQHF
jgi:hypothetical protein